MRALRGLIWTPTALVWSAALKHNHLSDLERPSKMFLFYLINLRESTEVSLITSIEPNSLFKLSRHWQPNLHIFEVLPR